MKTLLAGIVVAATVGIVSGKSMQPQLELEPHPTGPQMSAGNDTGRIPGVLEEQTPLAALKGPIPSYVFGADATAYEDARYDPPAVEPPTPFVTYSYNEPLSDPEPAVADDSADASAEAYAPEDANAPTEAPATG